MFNNSDPLKAFDPPTSIKLHRHTCIDRGFIFRTCWNNFVHPFISQQKYKSPLNLYKSSHTNKEDDVPRTVIFYWGLSLTQPHFREQFGVGALSLTFPEKHQNRQNRAGSLTHCSPCYFSHIFGKTPGFHFPFLSFFPELND